MDVPLQYSDDRIVSSIFVGKGAFGTVYKASVRDSGGLNGVAIYAIKRVSKLHDLDYLGATGILNEVEVLKWLRQFNHPNIIRLHGCCVHNNSLLMYMDYVPLTLSETIHKGYLKKRHVRGFTISILRVLNFLHLRGIIHCDIKPQNILIDVPNPVTMFSDESVPIKEDCLKLIDFGLCTAQALPDKRDYVVTIWYRPPELLCRNKEYTTTVDIWSACCTILEMNLKAPMDRSTSSRAIMRGTCEFSQFQKILDVVMPSYKDVMTETDAMKNKSGPCWEINYGMQCYTGEAVNKSAARQRRQDRHDSFWKTYRSLSIDDYVTQLALSGLRFPAKERPTAEMLLQIMLFHNEQEKLWETPPPLFPSDTLYLLKSNKVREVPSDLLTVFTYSQFHTDTLCRALSQEAFSLEKGT